MPLAPSKTSSLRPSLPLPSLASKFHRRLSALEILANPIINDDIDYVTMELLATHENASRPSAQRENVKCENIFIP